MISCAALNWRRRFSLLSTAAALALTLLLTPQLAGADPTAGAPESPPAPAAPSTKQASPPLLTVGVKVTPPFVVKRKDGQWEGISIELWRRVAAKLGLRFTFRELDLRGLLGELEAGTIDLAAAALTVTAERERAFDFTHPFYSTGLGIAVSEKRSSAWLGVLENFFSWRFLKVIGGLTALLLVVGLLVWLFERRRNPEQFGGRPRDGMAAGFWWSAVTMTTVGYGDKAPLTLGGRLVALVWMFGGIIIVSSFTAAITSSLTVSSLESPVRGPGDLPQVKVASVPASTSAAYLERRDIHYQAAADPAAALGAVAADQADAAVYDAPILQYLARARFAGKVQVLPGIFDRQDYAFALPTGSPLRNPVNLALLQAIGEPWWRELLRQRLGD